MIVNQYPHPGISEEDLKVEKAFRRLLNSYINSKNRKKVELVERAFRFARDAHKGMRRNGSDPFILHPLGVAEIMVSELGLGSTSICAALLHEVIDETDYTADDIRKAFGKKIGDIVEGLSKISGGIFGERALDMAESFRNLLLSMSTDIRVVLVKMADRLHNLRNLQYLRPGKQEKIVRETLHVYAPLAHRLGLYKIKSELENLAFKFEHPEKYQEIAERIIVTGEEREHLVEKFLKPLRKKLDEAGFAYEIKGRLKTPYSIHRKMVTKNVSFDEIFDLYAIRIIFENPEEKNERDLCWQIYDMVTEGNPVHPDRLRDWTTKPKDNGYSALHVTVMGPQNKWIEVQIRSRKMDDIAELGYAAHWKYKTGESADSAELDSWMNTIKDILADPIPTAIDSLDSIKLSLFSPRIYVFTPKGDLITLPSGATVLDMAFAIHSDMGLHCLGGKINHRPVSMSHILESGDKVQIITAANCRPEPDWLKACTTAKAFAKIRAYLRKERKLIENTALVSKAD